MNGFYNQRHGSCIDRLREKDFAQMYKCLVVLEGKDYV